MAERAGEKPLNRRQQRNLLAQVEDEMQLLSMFRSAAGEAPMLRQNEQTLGLISATLQTILGKNTLEIVLEPDELSLVGRTIKFNPDQTLRQYLNAAGERSFNFSRIISRIRRSKESLEGEAETDIMGNIKL